MRKGFELVTIALIGMLVLVLVEGVILVNFVYRLEFFQRVAKQTEITRAANTVEFVKKALNQALTYSFHQASYYIASRGGYSDFVDISVGDVNGDCLIDQKDLDLCVAGDIGCDLNSDGIVDIYDMTIVEANMGSKCEAVPSYNCIPYWRNYITTRYPTLLKNLEDVSVKALNNYVKKISDGIYIPQYKRVKIEQSEIEAETPEKLRFGDEYFYLTENVNMNKQVATKIFRIFDIGNERFVRNDAVGDTIKAANSYTDAVQKIYRLEQDLNTEFQPENIQFELTPENIGLDESSFAIRVLVKIKDNANTYPVYDYSEKTTDLRNIQLKFYILSGNYIVQPITNECTEAI